MKTLFTLLIILVVTLSACDQKKLDPLEVPLIGTYGVTHLTQYQNGVKVFEGSLPAKLGDSITIRHGISISLSTLKSSDTDAFITYNAIQKWSTPDSTRSFVRSYGRPVAQNRIRLKPGQSAGKYEFYNDKSIKLGSSNGQALSFDFVEPDSLGNPVRYVYEAKKTSSSPNSY